MKCPNCGYQLEKTNNEWICINFDCDFYGLNALVEWKKYEANRVTKLLLKNDIIN